MCVFGGCVCAIRMTTDTDSLVYMEVRLFPLRISQNIHTLLIFASVSTGKPMLWLMDCQKVMNEGRITQEPCPLFSHVTYYVARAFFIHRPRLRLRGWHGYTLARAHTRSASKDRERETSPTQLFQVCMSASQPPTDIERAT